MHEKRFLDADAVRDPADGERLVGAAASACDHDALEHLGAFLAALDDPRIDLHRIARADVGEALFQLVALDQIDDVHVAFLASRCARPRGDNPGMVSRAPRQKQTPFRLSRAEGVSQPRSGRRLAVRKRDCSRRQAAMRAWSPERRTSGTSAPRKAAGRVYAGASSPPSVNDSAASESGLSVPATRRIVASRNARAGISPPVTTKSPSEISSAP